MDSANKKRNWLIGGLLLCAIIVFLVMFIKQYRMLGQTIEEERSTYISEIKNQLVKNIQAEKEQQIALVNIYAQILTDLQPQYFEQVNRLLANEEYGVAGDEIFLMDAQGNVYTLEKERKTLSEQSLSYALTEKRVDVFGYSQINLREEFWIYGAPIRPIVIEQIEICAVINARSIQNFGKRMSTSILNNNGFSYIMSKSGNVLLYPSVENNMGYNLFHTLEASGVDEARLLEMKRNFSQGADGKEILDFRDDKWLLDYAGDMFDDWVVVVTMPMTITGADTYKMLSGTMSWILMLFSSIILFTLFVIRIFYVRERERERAIQQEKADLAIAQKIAESKNEFLAKMSHDIRTPLNAIIGLIQITSNLVSDRPKAAENLSQAGKAAEYLLSILNDILDMSKIESGKMVLRNAPFDITALMDSIKNINLAQVENRQIHFEMRTEGNLSKWYLGDQGRIGQILMNLLSNAVKFTNPGGHILFSISAEPESSQADRLIFQVKDDGVGMSEAYLTKLFQPFEQESNTQSMNRGGSGLGLAIVKNLTELMDGSVQVTSEKGIGSCFTVTLCLPHADNPQDASASEHLTSLAGKRVLLAEDNAINAMIAKELLEEAGELIVETVENGQEAVNRFGQSRQGYFDVILMDIRMPVMDGLTATQEIRALPHLQAQTIPIVAMSANAFDEDISRALECGMNAYLSKPVDIKKTLFTLAKLLKGSPQ